MRERLARLETVERPAARGRLRRRSTTSARCPPAATRAQDGSDTAERGGRPEPFAGGEGRDQLVELGGGNLIPGFEEGLVGAGAGETARRSS